MPNQLKEGTERVSYVESSDVYKALKLLSVYKKLSISSLIRNATNDLLKKEDPKGTLLQDARNLRVKQSDTPLERTQEAMDPKILEIAQRIHKNFEQINSRKEENQYESNKS
jgi:hypothetical protein